MATKDRVTTTRKAKQWTEQELVKVLRQKAQAYLRLPNVTSVGVGYKIKDGKQTDELCIQFTVKRKLKPAEVQAEGLTMLPVKFTDDDGSDVPVDVLERSYAASYEIVSDPDAEAKKKETPPRIQRRARQDPVMPGVSVSHVNEGAGTFGALVFDNQTAQPYILSNWHVLNGPSGRIGDEIVQPGPLDDGDIGNNRCGRLLRSHLGLAGDCAIASIEGRRFKEEILELGIKPKRTAKVSLNDRVVKSGRTTGVTFGIVTRVGVVAGIDYQGNVGIQQIGGFEITPDPEHKPAGGEVSMGGDSGSLWLIQENGSATDIAVGLHFAGETDPRPSEEHALACNIHSVLDKLNVSFVSPAQESVEEEDLVNAILESLHGQVTRLSYLERQMAAVQGVLPGAAPRQTAAPAASGTEQLGIPVYGNWCGPGHSGGTPVDDLDRACMDHDECYGQKGYFDCGCDGQLVRDIDTALASGHVKPWGRVVGPVIRQWFRIQPCIPRYESVSGGAGVQRAALSRAPEGRAVQAIKANGQWKLLPRKVR